MLRFGLRGSRQPHLQNIGIKVDFVYFDGQHHSFFAGRRRTGIRFLDDLAHRRTPHEISFLQQIKGMPQVLVRVGSQEDRATAILGANILFENLHAWKVGVSSFFAVVFVDWWWICDGSLLASS